MSAKRGIPLVLVVLLAVSAAACAQNARPYIGVQLDPLPLPELLTKHLGLKPDQGIRVKNVSLGSPADEIGIERDDIIIRFRGEDVTDVNEFVSAIQKAEVGTAVSLEIVHLGQRKTSEFELKPIDENPQWKYPAEPEIITSWRPGKFFRIGPNGQNWMEIPFDKIPDINVEVKKFLQERYTYHHTTDGEDYTITIEGDPKDQDTQVIVQVDDTEYSATVGELEKLPEKYRAAAQEAIQGALKSSKQRLRVGRIPLPKPPDPNLYRRYFKDLTVPMPDFDGWSERQQRMLERIQEQMERVQQRVEELEKRYRQAPGNPPDKQDKTDESTEPAAGAAGPSAKDKPMV